MPEMIFILLMALIIFGPKKLPEMGRQLGRALNEFKRASNEFKTQIESEIVKLDAEEIHRKMPPLPEDSRDLVKLPRPDEGKSEIVAREVAPESLQQTVAPSDPPMIEPPRI